MRVGEQKTHAEILADIAAQVVEQHRKMPRPDQYDADGFILFDMPDDAELSAIDSSWHYRLPEEWQG